MYYSCKKEKDIEKAFNFGFERSGLNVPMKDGIMLAGGQNHSKTLYYSSVIVS